MKNSESILSECILHFAPVGGGVLNKDNSLNVLGKELTL